MKNLYFGSTISIVTTALILFLTAFILISLLRCNKIARWGRRILIFVLVGTAISATSATRDAFMLEGGLFTMESIQALICSGAGALIFLFGFISIFVRSQNFRRGVFFFLSILFVVQVVAVESYRIAALIGG